MSSNVLDGPVPEGLRLGDCAECPRDETCKKPMCPNPVAYYTGVLESGTKYHVPPVSGTWYFDE